METKAAMEDGWTLPSNMPETKDGQLRMLILTLQETKPASKMAVTLSYLDLLMLLDVITLQML